MKRILKLHISNYRQQTMKVPILCHNSEVKVTSVTLRVHGSKKPERHIALSQFKCIECRGNVEQCDLSQNINDCREIQISGNVEQRDPSQTINDNDNSEIQNGFSGENSNSTTMVETIADFEMKVEQKDLSKTTTALAVENDVGDNRKEFIPDVKAAECEKVRFGEAMRKEFELDEHSAFLNNGSYGAAPKRVLDYRRR